MTNSYMLYCNLPAKCAQSIVPETAGPSRMSWVLFSCLFVRWRAGRALFTPWEDAVHTHSSARTSP